MQSIPGEGWHGILGCIIDGVAFKRTCIYTRPECIYSRTLLSTLKDIEKYFEIVGVQDSKVGITILE